LSKKKKNEMLNQMKKKNKEKEPKPNTGGHDRPFWKENSKDKRSGNKHK
jgi:hypothetical protein